MTVAELIALLERIEDKGLPVTVWNGAARTFGEYVVMQPEDVNIELQEPHYDFDPDGAVDVWDEQPGPHVRIG